MKGQNDPLYPVPAPAGHPGDKEKEGGMSEVQGVAHLFFATLKVPVHALAVPVPHRLPEDGVERGNMEGSRCAGRDAQLRQRGRSDPQIHPVVQQTLSRDIAIRSILSHRFGLEEEKDMATKIRVQGIEDGK